MALYAADWYDVGVIITSILAVDGFKIAAVTTFY